MSALVRRATLRWAAMLFLAAAPVLPHPLTGLRHNIVNAQEAPAEEPPPESGPVDEAPPDEANPVPPPEPPFTGSFDAPSPPSGAPSSAADVAALVAPSVVQVYTRNWLGSGVKVAAGILTNVSIVENNRTVRVVMPDGRDIEARVIMADPVADLALLSADEALPALEIEHSSLQRQGDPVLAFGYPRPLLIGGQATLTAGIISALRRDPDGVIYIQTDAALNPGNAGGALVNMQGRLIGLPILKARYSEGLGFAIAGEMMQAFLAGALLPTPVPAPTATPRPAPTPRPTSTPLPPRPTLAPLPQPTSNPAFSIVIRDVHPALPYCALRTTEDTSEALVVITGDNIPHAPEPDQTRFGLQFRNNLTGQLSQILAREVSFALPERVTVDVRRLGSLVWRDRRVQVSVRFFDSRFAPDYRPISDFSPPFVIADDQTSCR